MLITRGDRLIDKKKINNILGLTHVSLFLNWWTIALKNWSCHVSTLDPWAKFTYSALIQSAKPHQMRDQKICCSVTPDCPHNSWEIALYDTSMFFSSFYLLLQRLIRIEYTPGWPISVSNPLNYAFFLSGKPLLWRMPCSIPSFIIVESRMYLTDHLFLQTPVKYFVSEMWCRRSVGAVQDLVISELHGEKLLYVLHSDGTIRVWDISSRTRIFSHTMNIPTLTGNSVVCLSLCFFVVVC